MKNFKIIYLALAIIAMISYGCPGTKPDDNSTAYNTAVGYYFGNVANTGTALFSVDMYNASDSNVGVWLEGFSALPSSLFNFQMNSGSYLAATTGAQNTYIAGSKGDSGPIGTFVYNFNTKTFTLVTGGTFDVSYSGSSYTISTNFTGVDYSSGATVNNLHYKYTGSITFRDYSNTGGLAFTDIVKSNYTATGTPGWLSTPGPSSWTGQVTPSTGQSQSYTISGWGGKTVNVYCNYKNGQIVLDNTTKVADDGTYEGYFRAAAYSASASTFYIITDDYIVAYDKTTKIMDFSDTYNGMPVYVGVIGVNKTTGKMDAGFTDLYANAKLKLTPVSQSSSSAPSMNAEAFSFSKSVSAKSFKNYRIVDQSEMIQPLSKSVPNNKRALLNTLINNHN